MPDITKAMTDTAIVSELYERIETRRKNSNITQAEMAERIGITTKSYRAIQSGVCRLTTFVALLRQLDLLENLDGLIARPRTSPLQIKFEVIAAKRNSIAPRLKKESLTSISKLLEPAPAITYQDESYPNLRSKLLGQRQKLLIKDK